MWSTPESSMSLLKHICAVLGDGSDALLADKIAGRRNQAADAADAFVTLYYDMFQHACSWLKTDSTRHWVHPCVSEATGGIPDPLTMLVQGQRYVVKMKARYRALRCDRTDA